MEGVALGEWEGVKAGGSGEDDEAGVTELQLEANNVSGEILGIVATAAHHGLFNSLVCINIDDNNATGVGGVVCAAVPLLFSMGLPLCVCALCTDVPNWNRAYPMAAFARPCSEPGTSQDSFGQQHVHRGRRHPSDRERNDQIGGPHVAFTGVCGWVLLWV